MKINFTIVIIALAYMLCVTSRVSCVNTTMTLLQQ